MTTHFYHKSKNKKRHKHFGVSSVFWIGIVLIVCLIGINFADIISSLLSYKTSIFSGGKIRVPNSTMYAISLGQVSEITQAEDLANKVIKQGGAGYIYQSGDYFVFASLYDSVIDAKSVVDKLKQDNTQASIVNINIPVIKLNYKGKYEKQLLDGIGFFKKCYQELYKMSLAYDSGQITTAKLKDQISSLISLSKQTQNSIEKIINKENNTCALMLENKLLSITSLLEKLNITPAEGLLINGNIKNCYFKVIFLNIEYAKQV